MNVSIGPHAAGAAAQGGAHGVAIVGQTTWAAVWTDVAAKHLGVAQAARAAYATDPSTALTDEFQASLVSISASVFAIEAEKQRVLGPGDVPHVGPAATIPPGGKGNWGDHLGQHLVEHNKLSPGEAADLANLVGLRHDAVHPFATPTPLVPHPVGTNTQPEVVAYRVEVAEAALATSATVIAALS